MVIVVFAAAVFVSAARHARPQMVATEARKARRLAAALAKTGAADPTARQTPAPDARGGVRPLGRPDGCREETGVCRHGVEEERGIHAPAILRAVANAARNKEAKTSASKAADPPAAKSDWDCPACGKSNFAKRLMCFKCQAPKPGRKFTVAGMKGYEKRQAKREEKRRSAEAAGKTPRTTPTVTSASPRATRPRPPRRSARRRSHSRRLAKARTSPRPRRTGAREMRGTRRATPQSASPSRRAIRARLPSSFATRTRPWSTSRRGPRRKPSGRGAARRETHPGSNPPTDGNSIRTCRIGCFTTSSTRRRWTTTSSR